MLNKKKYFANLKSQHFGECVRVGVCAFVCLFQAHQGDAKGCLWIGFLTLHQSKIKALPIFYNDRLWPLTCMSASY